MKPRKKVDWIHESFINQSCQLSVLKPILWMTGSFSWKLTWEKFKVLSNRKFLKIDSIDCMSIRLHVYFGTFAYWHLSMTIKTFKIYWPIYMQDFNLLNHYRVKLSQLDEVTSNLVNCRNLRPDSSTQGTAAITKERGSVCDADYRSKKG